jgi:KUP system potassium uptake protein
MDTLVDLPARARTGKTQPRRPTAGLALLALGIVYGDIGTSPLYAAKETFNPQHGIPLTPENIVGGVSAIFWVLAIIVSLKYVTLVLRASNRGEGGIMALLALATSSVHGFPRLRAALLLIGVFGASLFYGDAVLTPAISVLSAVEGLEVGNTALQPYVVPIAVGILVALFAIQRFGTGVVGLLFGPVCALWFLSLGVVGVWHIAKAPMILKAIDPTHAFHFVTGHGYASFIVLGSVLLAVTGAEALYADMGHFGARAIRIAWFAVAAPALVLNYFGQGALLVMQPAAIDNPFYLAYPGWALYPMVMLATAATVIASQATISGAYSMTQQAIQLGYLPRMTIHHTSARTMDLRAGGQLDPARSGSCSRCRIRQLVAARLGVRRCGDGHDARDNAPHLLRASLRLALSAMDMRRRDRVLHADGRRAVRGGHAQDSRGRLVFTGTRRGRVQHHGHVAART